MCNPCNLLNVYLGKTTTHNIYIYIQCRLNGVSCPIKYLLCNTKCMSK